MILETKTSLLNLEATQGKTQELSILWTSLIRTHFKNNMIRTAPYQEKNSNQRYDLPDLRRRINNRITTTRRCLAEITSPVKSPIQKHMHGEYIKRIQELKQQANKDISDIETNHRKDITSTELESLKKSLESIKDGNSAASRNLCAWDASLPRPPIFSQEGITPLTSTLHHSHAQDSGYPSISTTDTLTKTEDTNNSLD